MMDMIKSRWILLKRHRLKLIFWLFIPLFVTVGVVYVTSNVSEDFRVPVAVVDEANIEETDRIIKGLEESNYIRIDQFESSEKDDALRVLEQYQYDSVLVFGEDFEDKILSGERRNMVETYYTDRSFAYSTVKELLASLIQESLNSHRITEQIQDLEMELFNETTIESETILETKNQIDTDTNLVSQNFTFKGEENMEEKDSTIDPWLVWAYVSLLTTVFIFDFVTRETRNETQQRFVFLNYSFKTFMMTSFLAMLIVMYMFDLVTLLIIKSMFDQSVSIVSLLIYRAIANIIVFIVAYYSRSKLSLYRNGLGLIGILLGLHIIMPFLNGISSFHPVIALVENNKNFVMLFVTILVLSVCLGRNRNARS